MASVIWHTKNFFRLLWNVHILHRCPVCKKKIIETDYPSELIQKAKCSDKNCGWGWGK